MNATDRLIKQCDNGSYCCRDLNSTCCEDGDGLWIDPSNLQLKNYNPLSTTSSSSPAHSTKSSNGITTFEISSSSFTNLVTNIITSPSPTITRTSSRTFSAISCSSSTKSLSTSLPNPSPTAKSQPTSKTVVIEGGAMGGVIGLAVLIGLAIFLYKKHQSKHISAKSKDSSTIHDRPTRSQRSWQKPEKEGRDLVETNGRPNRMELTGRSLVEMPHGDHLPAELGAH